jgi:hypothetical protein
MTTKHTADNHDQDVTDILGSDVNHENEKSRDHCDQVMFRQLEQFCYLKRSESFLAILLLGLLVIGAFDLRAQAYGPYYGPYWNVPYQQYLHNISTICSGSI